VRCLFGRGGCQRSLQQRRSSAGKALPLPLCNIPRKLTGNLGVNITVAQTRVGEESSTYGSAYLDENEDEDEGEQQKAPAQDTGL